MGRALLKAFICLLLIAPAWPAFAEDGAAKAVALQRLIAEAPPGARRATIKSYVFCSMATSTTMPATDEFNVAPLAASFRRAFAEAGLGQSRSTNLFESDGDSSAEYAMGGIIKAETYDLCIAYDRQRLSGTTEMTGSSSMTIEWQLYSRLEEKVVARTEITSKFSSTQLLHGTPAYTSRTLEENFKLLARDPTIRAALTRPVADAGAATRPAASTPIIVEGARSLKPKPIEQASKSVVVIFAGDSSGSGVLISRDGYILTNAHVVGDAASVRVRWADGKTAVATVLRSSRRRDVAVLKVDASGYEPLPLRDTPPPVASTVFVIGAPEGQQFEGTLTRGIVSAAREMDGLSYIQSDASIGPGSSGGPLLDDKGYVVGLAVSGFGRGRTMSSGLNMFIPVKDVIDFLSLDLR